MCGGEVQRAEAGERSAPSGMMKPKPFSSIQFFTSPKFLPGGTTIGPGATAGAASGCWNIIMPGGTAAGVVRSGTVDMATKSPVPPRGLTIRVGCM